MHQDFRPNELLRNDGVNQGQRMLPTLAPAFAKADERTLADFLTYTYQLAKEIRYYNVQNQPEADWTPFFDQFLDDAATGDMQPLAQMAAYLDQRHDLPPHLALLLAFFKLYGHAQQDLNDLTRRHLDYYFRDVLGIRTQPAVPNRVHILVEPARQAVEYRLPANTLLDAGKDPDGKPIRFRTEREVVVNQARVASVKTLFVEQTTTKGTLIQAAPVADSADGRGKPFDDTPAWRPFGSAQTTKPDSEQTMTLGELGFALSTPILSLADGTRTVTLSILLDNPGLSPSSLANAFELRFSGEKGWITPDSVTDISVRIVDLQPVLTISAVLSATQPAIVTYDDNVLKGAFQTPYPVLKLTLNQAFSQFDVLQNLIVRSISIQVSVDGAKPTLVQNDESGLDATRPFTPFGSQPAIGANLYVGSAEIFTKRLTEFTLRIEWNKQPADLAAYYAGYFPRLQNQITQSSFVGALSMLTDGRWQPIGQDALFEGPGGKRLDLTADNSTLRSIGQHRTEPADSLQRFEPGINTGFIRLELAEPTLPLYDFEAFGHAVFPTVYAQKAVALSKAAPGEPVLLPNPPYTPQVKSLTIDYVAEETFTPKAADVFNRFWYIEPFGHRQLTDNEAVTLLPAINGQAFCYIGLDRFEPPRTISLLVQTEDGTSLAETPDDLLNSRDITWSYLAGNRWIDLRQSDVLAESTEGFQKAGIVMLAIGRGATRQHTLMPSGLHWLRAAVGSARKADGASNVRSLLSQAVEAVFVSADPAQTIQGVAANTIKKLVTPQTAIRKIDQPFASFGGRATETDTAYYTRVSERLRHKNRLSTSWDYEHLVLQAFPAIFKVRCLPHQRPGEVSLIVVPNLRDKNYGNPLEPRCSTVLLRTIEAYLRPFTSAFVTVSVGNPTYEQILLDFKVAFRAGKDAGYYAAVLNEEIKRFLSPWAYEEGRDIPFGGKVYKSDLLAFVEDRDYVDFVTEFSMYHLYQGPPRGGIGTMAIGADFFVKQQIPATINSATGGTIGTDFVIGEPVDSTLPSPDIPAIIVSAPQHRIATLSAGELTGDGVGVRSGIGYMVIGLDFDVPV